jgi:hypothetical protein
VRQESSRCAALNTVAWMEEIRKADPNDPRISRWMPRLGRIGEQRLSEDASERGIDILTETLQAMGKLGITKQEALPVLIGFMTAAARIMGGEAAAEAAVVRIRDRIAEWKVGHFPGRSTHMH